MLLGFSQTFLNLTASVDGDVCPGVDVVYNCTTDDTTVRWTAAPYFFREPLLKRTLANDDLSSGPITISTLSNDPFTSTLTITSSDNLNSTNVLCVANEGFVKNFEYRRIQGK